MNQAVTRLRDGTRISPRKKFAAIGGEPDQQFEQSFASLAYSYISEKAPALLDYLVGFQLVDRNDDNTKAAGIFGFKMGNSWLYAPVFFINGDLKGHELLYLKGQDMFVPLKENWINYIINRKPHMLGEGSNQNLDRLGVLQPDLQSLAQPPGVAKRSSHKQRPELKDWFVNSGGLQTLARWVTTSPDAKYAGLMDRLTLGNFLAEDPELVKLSLDLRRNYPGIKLAMDYFYGSDLLKTCLVRMQQQLSNQPGYSLVAKRADLLPGGKGDNKSPGSTEQKEEGQEHEKEHTNDPAVAKEIAEDHLAEDPQYYTKLEKIEKDAVAENPKKVEILTDEVITENLPEMTESEQEKLLRDGYLIRDHRKGEEVSVAYNTQIEMALVNPSETGVYDVLVREGKFERCLFIMNPHAENGRRDFATLVRLSSGDSKGHLNADRSRIFIRTSSLEKKSPKSVYGDWFDDLADKTSLEVGSKYVVVTEDGDGTCVFTVNETLGDGSYEVSWDDYCSYSYRRDHGPYQAPAACGTCCCTTVNFGTRRGRNIKSYNGVVYFPVGARAITVAPADRCRKCGKTCRDCTCDYCSPERRDPQPEISPGSLDTVQLQLMQKSAESLTAASLPATDAGLLRSRDKVSQLSVPDKLRPLKVWSDHHEVVINSHRMSKLAGLFRLVTDFGLREKQAKKIIQDAELGRVGRYWVKVAYPYPGEIGPYAAGEQSYGVPLDAPPAISSSPAYGNVPVQEYTGEQYQTVPGLQSSLTDMSIYDPMRNIDPQAMQVAQQAQQTGQKEVFDTTMISTMLNAVRQDSIVDRYLGDLMKALDRWCRILLHFYWHNEEFADRYGKKDLPELEDTLRNVVEGSGDAILFLKQKTVEPSLFGSTPLSDVANN